YNDGFEFIRIFESNKDYMKAGPLVIIICLAFICGKAIAQTNNASSSKMNTMKQFSLLVRVPDTYGKEQAQLAGPLWDKLIDQWKEEGVYILSFPFPGESYTVSGSEKIVRKETVLSNNLKVVSNIVLQSESMEQALDLAKSCPILLYGGTVEVREIPAPIKLNQVPIAR
ncbi:MAG TPA: hypothetical protein VGD31_16360, partial [Sphingobacteriaceae bacterium]